MKISKGTIIRLIMLAFVVLNMILKAFDKPIIDVDEGTIAYWLEMILEIAVIIVAFWKNNSFSEAAIKADEFLHNLRNGDEPSGGMAKYRSPFKASSRQTTAFKVKGNWAAGYHTGVDRVCDSNRALVSPANGTVQKNAYSASSYGYYVIITTDEGMSILMAHMKEKSPLKVGAKIKAGDAVGTMGSTGNSTGPHLHIEIENAKTWAYNTKLLDPNDYIDWSDVKSVGTETEKNTSPTFKVGSTYTLTTNIKVRTGAGTNYAQKKRSQLTTDGQKHALNQTMAVLPAGTKVTALEVKSVNNDIWLRIPSGWICGYYKGDIYAK